MPAAAKSLAGARVLVIGGSLFMGPSTVEALLAAAANGRPTVKTHT